METTLTLTHKAALLARIRDRVEQGRRFLVTSHARPDGDSIGSQVAIALALRSLRKDVRVINHDRPSSQYLAFPGVADIEIAEDVTGDFDAAIVLECGDLSRPGLTGLERYVIINIDHHLGNAGYGAINWFDETAAACGEMVYDLIAALDVPLTPEIATHVYLAILTDTGSFHHANVTSRTFEICRRLVEAGIDPVDVSRRVFDSNTFGTLKLIGALLQSMELEASGRLAVMYLDETLLRQTGCTHGDTEGLVNLPLTAREIEAVVLFKLVNDQIRVSLRSKGDVDVRAVAERYGGGGHKNASGFTAAGPLEKVRALIIGQVGQAIDAGSRH